MNLVRSVSRAASQRSCLRVLRVSWRCEEREWAPLTNAPLTIRSSRERSSLTLLMESSSGRSPLSPTTYCCETCSGAKLLRQYSWVDSGAKPPHTTRTSSGRSPLLRVVTDAALGSEAPPLTSIICSCLWIQQASRELRSRLHSVYSTGLRL